MHEYAIDHRGSFIGFVKDNILALRYPLPGDEEYLLPDLHSFECIEARVVELKMCGDFHFFDDLVLIV